MFGKQEIEKYFLAEKQLGLLFIIIGSVAVVLAIIFYFFIKAPFYKGAAISLLIVGLIQLVVGFTVYSRSDEDRARNVYAYDMNPAQLKTEELPRIKKVLGNFVIIKWAEMALVVTGFILIFYYRGNAAKTFWYGFGLALTIQVLILFIGDMTAEKRAKLYTSGLETFVNKR